MHGYLPRPYLLLEIVINDFSFYPPPFSHLLSHWGGNYCLFSFTGKWHQDWTPAVYFNPSGTQCLPAGLSWHGGWLWLLLNNWPGLFFFPSWNSFRSIGLKEEVLHALAEKSLFSRCDVLPLHLKRNWAVIDLSFFRDMSIPYKLGLFSSSCFNLYNVRIKADCHGISKINSFISRHNLLPTKN